MVMVGRHFAWFNVESGAWIGEWLGTVPAPSVPPSLIGDARLMLLNEWQQQVQRMITPSGSPYVMCEQVWDLDAWDNCPDSGAVCLDVTLYQWPVGDFYYAIFDGVDRILDFREMRTFLQMTPARATLDAHTKSPRPVRSTPTKLVVDITGTPLEPWVDRLDGQFVKRDGRIVFEPSRAGLPDAVSLSLTDRNPDLGVLLSNIDPDRVLLARS